MSALFFTIFFSGLSIPIAAALIAHPLGIDMSWTTTSKSVEKSNFFKQLPKIFKGFWKQMLISLLALVRPSHADLGVLSSQRQCGN